MMLYNSNLKKTGEIRGNLPGQWQEIAEHWTGKIRRVN